MASSFEAMQESIAAGLDFILTQQENGGSWCEWELPPGSSRTWSTAYIGVKLCSLPPLLKAKAAPAISAAARWLLQNGCAEGGWGYNSVVGPDADSTAFAILLLDSVGLPIPSTAVAFLARCQQSDGGFSTFQPDGLNGSWAASHPDVTPIVLLALATLDGVDRRTIDRGIGYVMGQRTEEGLWHSFWWESSLYGTEASLSLLRMLNIETTAPANLSQSKTANVFEEALKISILLYLNAPGKRRAIHDLTDNLIAQQLADGSWSPAPILRITKRDCFEPWIAKDPGPLYADPHRLFTTTTALHALSRVLL